MVAPGCHIFKPSRAPVVPSFRFGGTGVAVGASVGSSHTVPLRFGTTGPL